MCLCVCVGGGGGVSKNKFFGDNFPSYLTGLPEQHDRSTLPHCGPAFFAGVRMEAPSSQCTRAEASIGRSNTRSQKARKSQSIRGLAARSSSSETTFSIYLKRTAPRGSKWAGVWRWHASFLCLDTKSNFKWGK